MDSHLISESILRCIEERRRRLKEKQKSPSGAAPAAAKLGAGEVSACAAELDRTIRNSILSSFSQWEVNLVPQVEEMVRQAGPGLKAAAAPGSGEEGAAVSDPCPPASLGEEILPPARTLEGPGGGDSWSKLAEDVRDLHQELQGQSFESCFPEEKLEPAPAVPAAPEGPSSEPEPAAERAAAVPSEELGQKLDELIRLVRNSMDDRAGGPVAGVTPQLSQEIAREVAGRLQSALSGLKSAAASDGAGTTGAAAPEERIPLDDVASIIDQITGSSPP
jgi:hypothetical protein